MSRRGFVLDPARARAISSRGLQMFPQAKLSLNN